MRVQLDRPDKDKSMTRDEAIGVLAALAVPPSVGLFIYIVCMFPAFVVGSVVVFLAGAIVYLTSKAVRVLWKTRKKA